MTNEYFMRPHTRTDFIQVCQTYEFLMSHVNVMQTFVWPHEGYSAEKDKMTTEFDNIQLLK